MKSFSELKPILFGVSGGLVTGLVVLAALFAGPLGGSSSDEGNLTADVVEN